MSVRLSSSASDDVISMSDMLTYVIIGNRKLDTFESAVFNILSLERSVWLNEESEIQFNKFY